MTAMLEREAELAAIAAAVAAVPGGMRVLAAEGPAGIGKTRLLAEARTMAQAAGLRVLTAVGGELERDVPFGIARQLLGAELAAAPPEVRERMLAGEARWAAQALGAPGAPASADLAAALHGLFWMVTELTAGSPLALVVDDAHWADVSSVRFLEHLARRAAELPVLLVVGTRPNEPGAPEELATLLSLPAVRTIRLAPLTAEGTGRLVRELVEEAGDAFCRSCHEVTGGNPFLLTETARAARAAGTTVDVEAIRPDSVSRSVLRRLRQVPEQASSLADAAAVLGKEGELRHAALLAGQTIEEAEAAAATLVDIGILADAGTPMRFVHPLVRTTIYQARPKLERSSSHRRLAQALLEEGADAEHAALHLLSAAPAGQAWAVEALRQGARAARDRGAPDVASRYLVRAVEEPPPAKDRADVLRELATCERRASTATALEHLEAAMTLETDARRRRSDRQRLAFWTYGAGRAPEAVPMLDAVAAEAAEDDPAEAWSARANAFAIAVYAGLPDLEQRAAALASAGPGAPAVVEMAIAYRHALIGVPHDQVRVELSDAARRLEIPRNGVQPALWNEIAVACVIGEVYDVLDPLVEQALAAAREAGSLYHTAGPLCWAALGALKRGRLGAAEQHAHACVEALQPGLTDTYDPPAAYVLAEVALERGDVAAARAWVDTGRIRDERRMLSQGWTLPVVGRVVIAEGRLEEGLDLLRESGRWLTRHDFINPSIAWWRSTMAFPLAAAGRRDEAVALAEEELELARRFGGPRTLGLALHAAGVAHGGEPGVALLEEAVVTLERSEAALELARARASLGSELRRSRRRREAREPLRLALDGALRCRATALARFAREELEATGARLRTGLLSGLEAMTPSERRVAELAAQGLSNRQIAETLFVTMKTVEAHLGRVFRKLDVSSRTELADALNPSAG